MCVFVSVFVSVHGGRDGRLIVEIGLDFCLHIHILRKGGEAYASILKQALRECACWREEKIRPEQSK